MINPRIIDVLCTARAALDAAIVAHTAPRSTDRFASIVYVGVTPTDGRRLYTMPHDLSASALHAWASAEFAAKATFGGHSDWRVPTKDELELFYIAKDAIGGFQPVWYWSSTGHLEKPLADGALA